MGNQLRQRKPMNKGTGFKRKTLERVRHPATPVPMHLRRKASFDRCQDVVPVTKPKANHLVSKAYRMAVCTLPCAHCGIQGHSQPCHADQHKGMSLKTDDRTCWPGCGAHGTEPGCHHLLGSTGTYPREERREIEARYARQTRATILAAGLWPKRLPLMQESP